MLKRSMIVTMPLAAAAVLALAQPAANAAAAAPNLSGTYRCGPDAKACEWSGTSFTVTQTGNSLDIKNDKGALGTAQLTSNISISAGPPWNMLGVISGDARTIDWSNGTRWSKQ
jgi:hypothetical protein